MNVSITIPCRNEELYIKKCLQSIIDCDYPKDLLSVFVVDGMSEDSTREIVNQFCESTPYIHLLDNKEQVTPFALNIGLKADDADIKIILGAHSTINDKFVSRAVKTLMNDQSVGCSGGVIQNVYENKVSEIIGLAMSSSFGVGNAKFRTGGDDGYVDTVAFGAYKKEVFEKIGYFDEDLVRNQDDEFNYRLLKNGFKIWLAGDIISNYYVRGNFLKLFRQYYQYGYWKVFVNTKHKAVTSVRQLVPLIFVLYLFGFVLAAPILPTDGQLLYVLGLLLYLFAAMFFAVKKSSKLLVALSVVKAFVILHVSYGLGYLLGLFHFVLLKKDPSSKSKKMSR
jgi:glycosyltransferase involved in cell wall biosynthesis